MAEMILPVIMAKSAVYNQLIGIFHGNWSAIDLYTDYAIYKFLRVTPQQGHLITSGMMFGRKARLLDDLLKHSDDPRKSKMIEAFNKIRTAKRDILTHSYVRSDALTVTFMERKISGPFSAKEHTFTFQELQTHALDIADAAAAFFDALGATQADIDAFANAALSLNRKSNTSPGNPIDHA